MRGTSARLGTPYPIAGMMPGVFQDDPLMCQVTAVLDEVVAPVVATLDCLDAYLDPALAPEDFLGWLGTWVGMAVDPAWPLARRRAVVAGAVPLYARRGTVAGLRAHLELLTGSPVHVTDSGEARWSVTPTDEPDAAEPWLLVEVDSPQPGVLMLLDEVVSSAKPAHVPHRTRERGHDDVSL